MKKMLSKFVLVIVTCLVMLGITAGCEGESTTNTAPKAEQVEKVSKKEAEKKETKKKSDKPYVKLVSVKRNFAESCYDYEYGEKDYLSVDLSKDTDINGYNWDLENVTVTTKEGDKLESIIGGKDDVSFKYIDSEEYEIKVRYDSIRGHEKYQTFKVKKDDIVQGKIFNASQCDEESSSGVDTPPAVDEADIPNADSPSACGPGKHWVKGHYRSGSWVDGYCRKN